MARRPDGPYLRIAFPYDKASWADQAERVCQLIESSFPGNPIDSAIVFHGSVGSHQPVNDRMAFLKSRVKTKLCRFTLDNHSSCVAASGVIGTRYYGHMGTGGTVDVDGRYSLLVSLPPNQTDLVYAKFGEALLALFGSTATRL